MTYCKGIATLLTMKQTTLILMICIVFLVPLTARTTVIGTQGYIVVPSAELVPSNNKTAVSTGYSVLAASGQTASIPTLSLTFSDKAEATIALDITQTTDLLLTTKYQISHTASTSYAVGLVSQLHDLSQSPSFSAQLYLASTFDSTVMELQSKTTVLVGYSFKKGMGSNIDFALGFQTPLFPQTFKDKFAFLLDFGNVSYSTAPTFGDADNRGLVNVGIRLLPTKLLESVFLSMDIRALDLFDQTGRAISFGSTISFQPN